MYEFNHQPISRGIPRGDFDFRRLERIATTFFVECPRFITLLLHSGLLETTPIHCYGAGDRKVYGFFVPKQKSNIHLSHEGLRFSTVKVLSKEGKLLWLVVCEWNRQGFLVPDSILNDEGKPVRLSFRKRKYAQERARNDKKISRRHRLL